MSAEYEVQFTRKTEVSGTLSVKANSEGEAESRIKTLLENGTIDPDLIKQTNESEGVLSFPEGCEDVTGLDWDRTAISEEYEFDSAEEVG